MYHLIQSRIVFVHARAVILLRKILRCIRPSWIIIIVRLHDAAELRRIKRRLQTAQIAALSPSVGKEIILNQ